MPDVFESYRIKAVEHKRYLSSYTRALSFDFRLQTVQRDQERSEAIFLIDLKHTVLIGDSSDILLRTIALLVGTKALFIRAKSFGRRSIQC